MNDQEQRVALLGVIADVLDALGLDPDEPGFTRTLPCYNAIGQPTGENHAEYTSGAGIGNGVVTEMVVDGLAHSLGVTLTEDSHNTGVIEQYRLLRFSGARKGITVYVTLRLDADNSMSLGATTVCSP